MQMLRCAQHDNRLFQHPAMFARYPNNNDWRGQELAFEGIAEQPLEVGTDSFISAFFSVLS
jgi:hypothetical protein